MRECVRARVCVYECVFFRDIKCQKVFRAKELSPVDTLRVIVPQTDRQTDGLMDGHKDRLTVG